MNSVIRRYAQYYVASWFERLGGRVEGGRALEVGCGGGAGVKIILERFGAAQVEAFDLDPKMIEHARRHLPFPYLVHARLSVGDVTSIQTEDATFDAVFDFGAIHLEPNWPKAISEVRRVLKPGGKFYVELVTNRALQASYRLVTETFQHMEPPRPELFLGELERQGIMVGRSLIQPRLAAFTGWVGDLIGVGRYPAVFDHKVIVTNK